MSTQMLWDNCTPTRLAKDGVVVSIVGMILDCKGDGKFLNSEVIVFGDQHKDFLKVQKLLRRRPSTLWGKIKDILN